MTENNETTAGGETAPAAQAAARRLAARRQPMTIRDLEVALIANARKSRLVI